MSQLVVGIVSVLLAIGLVFIGRPNRAGQHPRFLQFESSLVLFPPLVLVFGALGIAEIVSGLLSL